MCGRFVSASPPDELARYFDVEQVAETVLDPSYNVAPTNDVYVVVETGGIRRLDAFHWGLIPFWAKDIKVGQKMINARAETHRREERLQARLPEAPLHHPRRRLLRVEEDPRPEDQAADVHPPHRRRADRLRRAVGAVEAARTTARTTTSTWVRSCTIITGEPNETVAPIHDRMPVMLPPSAWDDWLDPENDDVDTLGKLLVPAPASLITAHPVSTG